MAFSIKQLLVVVLVAAVGLAGLLHPERDLFQNLMNVLTVAILIYFAYGIWTTTGEERAFCVGFFVWCALYFIDHARKFLGIHLGLPDALSLLYVQLNLEATSGQGTYDPMALSRFHDIGQCVFALLLGLIGGWVTVYFYRQREKVRKATI
jgi:hypothetical protein